MFRINQSKEFASQAVYVWDSLPESLCKLKRLTGSRRAWLDPQTGWMRA